MTTTPRPVLLMLAGAVVVAVPVGWLIAEYLRGFGVPIGARLGIGLLMIPGMFAVILVTASAVWGLRARSRQQGELQALGIDEQERADRLKLFERFRDLDRSALARVTGIGQVVESDRVTVEFLALELRGGGGTITLRAHGPRLASAPGTVQWPRVAIWDDLDTAYDVVPGAGGGGDDSMQYEVRFVPAPPPEARTLEVAIVEFSPSAWPADPTHATGAARESSPWRAAVVLR